MYSRVLAGGALLAALGLASIPGAHAQSPATGLAIAAELGVGLDELVACTNEARGRAAGDRGTPERRTAMQALVLACLQQTRPELTADRYNAVIAKYRPAPP